MVLRVIRLCFRRFAFMTRDVQMGLSLVIKREFANYEHKRKRKHKRIKLKFDHGNLCKKEIAYGGLLKFISLLEDH